MKQDHHPDPKTIADFRQMLCVYRWAPGTAAAEALRLQIERMAFGGMDLPAPERVPSYSTGDSGLDDLLHTVEAIAQGAGGHDMGMMLLGALDDIRGRLASIPALKAQVEQLRRDHAHAAEGWEGCKRELDNYRQHA